MSGLARLRPHWPRSLFGRHALLIVGLILCAELLLALAYHRLVQRPRIEHMAETAQRYLGLLAGAMAHMDTAARQAYLAQLARQPEPVLLRLQPEAPPPDQPATLLQRLSLERLQQGLGPGQALAWTRSPQPRLWLRTELDGRAWWLGLDVSALGRERGSLLLALMLGAGALAALGATLIQRHLHRPLQQLQRAAERLAQGEFPRAAVAPGAPSEIAALAASFEQMAQQLESTERERALMLAGLSHDLRTPLAKLRLAAEILQVPGEEDLLRGMVRNIAVADQIIEQFIDFARLGAGEAQALCHAEELVRDVAAGLASPRLHLRPADPGLPPLLCRPLALRRALANVVENALKYSEGPVELSLQRLADPGGQGAHLALQVRDHGPGIPADQLQALRQPFARLDRARGGPPGAGLGLAIVERILRLEGGTLELNPLPDGLQVSLLLPQAAQAAT